MPVHGMVEGLKLSNKKTPTFEGCIMGKIHRALFPRQAKSQTNKKLQLVHSDLISPVEVPSIRGNRYFINFIDYFTNWVVAFTMYKKLEALNCFKTYKSLVENESNSRIPTAELSEHTITALRSDNGGEDLSNAFKDYLSENDISHHLTVAHSSQQNGVADG